MSEEQSTRDRQELMPSAERIASELAQVKSMDDFFGREGVLARLFGKTLERMLEGELTDALFSRRSAHLLVIVSVAAIA